MNQQQNKRSSKNYKRNSEPAKLLSNEYAIYNSKYELKANFKTIEEVKDYKSKCNEQLIIYNIKVYRLKNKSLTIKNKEN